MTIITRTINNKLIDLHSHIIYGVDDGAKTKEESIAYLKEAAKYGIKHIVCTPHICRGNEEKIERIKRNFLDIKECAEKEGIKLYLGSEILMSEDTCKLLQEKRLRSLNGSKYVLVEFRRNENMDIDSLIYMLEELTDMGYVPVLAHPELYPNYRNIKYIRRIRESGVLLQLDATSIYKKTSNKSVYKFSKKLLKEKLIDLVSSDTHCNKKRSYLTHFKAYKIIRKKYGKEYANIIFVENQKQILKIND